MQTSLSLNQLTKKVLKNLKLKFYNYATYETFLISYFYNKKTLVVPSKHQLIAILL